MNAYSAEDLRKKIVEAKERGVSTAGVARAFVSLLERLAVLSEREVMVLFGGSFRGATAATLRVPRSSGEEVRVWVWPPRPRYRDAA